MAILVTGEQRDRVDAKFEEIKRQLRQRCGYPYDLESLNAVLQSIIEGRFPNQGVDPIRQKVNQWVSFYRIIFNLEIGEPDISFLPCRSGYDWLVIIAKDLTLAQVIQACKDRFPLLMFWSQDVTLDARSTEQTYAFWCRNDTEPDLRESSRSYTSLLDSIAGKKYFGYMTLLERLILELWYYWACQKHLDEVSRTICAGSVFSDDHVPIVYYKDGRVEVDAINQYFATPFHRARSIYLLPPAA